MAKIGKALFIRKKEIKKKIFKDNTKRKCLKLFFRRNIVYRKRKIGQEKCQNNTNSKSPENTAIFFIHREDKAGT